MCDSFAVGPGFTRAGVRIFGKNSDREPDEAHLVLSIPRKHHDEGDTLTCTYITIPEAKETNAVVICKPFWIWGAEMGVNERGVVIGNEALFTKKKPEKNHGLIGMDLLRLALERADSARAATEVIIELLVRYGQSGPCGYRDKKFTYMNSFLIMDRKDILVLETVGRDYAVKQHQEKAAISNAITMETDWDYASFPKGTDVSRHTDRIMTYFSGSACRREKIDDSIKVAGTLELRDAFRILRSHYTDSPLHGFNRDVCMHASDPLIRRSQTTCSMVVELKAEERFRIFVTAGSVPCLTTFKPFLPACPYGEAGIGGGQYTENSYWWSHERFSMNASLRYARFHELIAADITDLEERFCLPLPGYVWDAAHEDLQEYSYTLFRQSREMEDKWVKEMIGVGKDAGPLPMYYWKRMARRNNVPFI
jgi:dipeptidase